MMKPLDLLNDLLRKSRSCLFPPRRQSVSSEGIVYQIQREAETPYLCEECMILQFNEESAGGQIGPDDDKTDAPYVCFREAHERSKVDSDKKRVIEKVSIPYGRRDSFPYLERLGKGVAKGCEFCRMLRDAFHRHLQHDLKDIPEMDLHIKELNYVWVAPEKGRSSGWTPKVEQEPRCDALVRRGILRVLFEIVSVEQKIRNGDQYLDFDLCASSEALASWLRIPQHTPPDSYLDPSVMDQMNRWLEITEGSLESLDGKEGLPTRLIDVGGRTGTDHPRLVISQELESDACNRYSYAALSHCWGDPGDLKLKTKTITLKEHLQGIPLEAFPPSFRDAILVTRALQLQYLWIDALCIIQDDPADWAVESSRMGDVYQRAHLTIVTLKSGSPKQGFLERTKRPSMEMKYASSLNPDATGIVRLYHPMNWQDKSADPYESDIGRSRWARRAWILQEKELSSRLLFFGDSMVHLRDRFGVIFSENGHHDNTPPFMLENDRRPIICHDSFTIQDYYWSYTLIKDYSSRELTYPEDRLPGICAIAKMVQQMTGDQYLAGIWRSDLPTALLWQSYGDDRATLSDAVHELTHPSPYIAPSWSWARGKQNVILEIESRQDETSIVEAETFPEDANNPLGRVTGGYLIIRGKLLQLRGDKKPSLRLVSTHLETKIMFGDELAAIANPDWRNPRHLEDFEHDLSRDTLRGLSMLLLTSQDADEFGLLLLPKSDSHEWVRVGTFQTNGRARNPSGHSLFHDSELRDITLV